MLNKQTFPISFLPYILARISSTTTKNATQIQTTNSSNMSAPNTSPQTPSAATNGQVIFQSTTNSGVNSTRSSNEGPTTPNLELSKEEVFEKKLR